MNATEVTEPPWPVATAHNRTAPRQPGGRRFAPTLRNQPLPDAGRDICRYLTGNNSPGLGARTPARHDQPPPPRPFSRRGDHTPGEKGLSDAYDAPEEMSPTWPASIPLSLRFEF